MAEGVRRLFGDREPAVQDSEAGGRWSPGAQRGTGPGPPAPDRYIYMDGKCEAILLGSLYPDELSRERARQAFQKANPDREVEVRCRTKETKGAGDDRPD